LSKSQDLTWLQNFDQDLASLTQEHESLKQQLVKEKAELEKICEGLKGKTDKIQAQIEAKQQELAPWTEKMNEKQVQMDIARSELTLLTEQSEAIGQAMTQAEQRVDELQTSQGEKMDHLQGLKKQHSKLLSKMSQLKKEMSEFEQKTQHSKDSLQMSKLAVEEAKMLMQKAKTRGNVHQSLMQQKHAGKIKGICVSLLFKFMK
jgi:structural maintenance of chromosome 4